MIGHRNSWVSHERWPTHRQNDDRRTLETCLILTLVWASENTASSTCVSPCMFRKTFGGCGFAPDPEWGLILPHCHTPPIWGEGLEKGGEGERRGIITRIGDMITCSQMFVVAMQGSHFVLLETRCLAYWRDSYVMQGDHSLDNAKFSDNSPTVRSTPPRHSAC